MKVPMLFIFIKAKPLLSKVKQKRSYIKYKYLILRYSCWNRTNNLLITSQYPIPIYYYLYYAVTDYQLVYKKDPVNTSIILDTIRKLKIGTFPVSCVIRILYKQEYYPLTAPIRDKKPTYTARHSFSTILKRSGAYIEFASENLGHADFKTTENYLDSFEDGMKREFANQLLNFKKSKGKDEDQNI